MSFRFLSICSGIEAASVAFAPLGWTPVAFSEIEAFPSVVLRHHYPDTPNLGDMTKFMDWPEELLAQADVLCGGTPCQAFSVAGKRESLGDNRGNLTLTFIQLCNHVSKIRESRNLPAPVILWENVPGVLNTKDNAFGCFLGGLVGEDDPLLPAGGKWTNAGCVFGPERTAVFRTLDAQWFGLAQRRKRVFVVASSGDGSGIPEILLEREGVRRDSAPSRKAGEETAGGVAFGISPDCFDRSGEGAGGTAGERSGLGLDEELSYALRAKRAGGVASVCPTLRAGGNRTGGDRPPGTDVDTADSLIPVAYRVHGDKSTAMTGNGVANVADPVEVARCLDSCGGYANGQGGNIVSHATVAFDATGSSVDAGDVFPTLRKREGGAAGHGASVAYSETGPGWISEGIGTIRAEGENRPSRPCHTVLSGPTVRRLTPTECERLQGFPNTYTSIPWRGKPAEECPDGPRYKALGNSWAVPCVAWIGRRLDAFLKGGKQA